MVKKKRRRIKLCLCLKLHFSLQTSRHYNVLPMDNVKDSKINTIKLPGQLASFSRELESLENINNKLIRCILSIKFSSTSAGQTPCACVIRVTLNQSPKGQKQSQWIFKVPFFANTMCLQMVFITLCLD